MTARKEIKGIYEGPILPVTVRIGLPILLSNILQFLYAIVDTIFIARIDPSSTALLSGTGLIFPLFFFFMSVGASLSVGVSSVVGRLVGQRDLETASHVSASALAIAAVIALPALVAGYALGPLVVEALAGSGLSAEAVSYGWQYFSYLLPGMTILLLGHVAMGVLQGQGLTRLIAHAMAISTITNIVLDPLFIFTFGLGVRGASIATTIAVTVAMGYVLVAFMRKKSGVPLRWRLRFVRRALALDVVRIGFPHFLSMASLAISFMFLNKLVGVVSQESMNAWTLAGRMDQLVLIPSFAVAGATVPMIAQNFGRNNLARVWAIYKTNLVLAWILVLAAGLLYIVGAPALFSLFSNVDSVVDAAVRQVRIVTFTFLGVCTAIISASAFQATGRPVPALVITLVRMGVVSIPTAALLVILLRWGMSGVYAGLAAGNLIVLPLALIWAGSHLRKLKYERVEE